MKPEIKKFQADIIKEVSEIKLNQADIKAEVSEI